MRYSTISKIGAFTALSSSSTDYLRLDPSRCTGGADAPLRTTVEPASGIDGAIIMPPLDDAQIITLGGDLIITSSGTEAGYLAAIDTLLASLNSALASLKTAAGDLTHSGGTVKVWKYGQLDTTWSGITMSVQFSVVVDVFA